MKRASTILLLRINDSHIFRKPYLKLNQKEDKWESLKISFKLKLMDMSTNRLSCIVVKQVISRTSAIKRSVIPFLFLSGTEKYFWNEDFKIWKCSITISCTSWGTISSNDSKNAERVEKWLKLFWSKCFLHNSSFYNMVSIYCSTQQILSSIPCKLIFNHFKEIKISAK